MDFSGSSGSGSTKSRVATLAIALLSIIFASCDGGGGGSEPAPAPGLPTGQNTLRTTEDLIKSVKIESDLSAITLDNSPKLLMTLYEFILLGNMLYNDFSQESVRHPDFSSFNTGTSQCPFGGSVTVSVDTSRKNLTTVFDRCTNDSDSGTGYTTVSGTERTRWIDGPDVTRILQEFHDVSVASDGQTSRLRGVSELAISNTVPDASYMILNIEASDSTVGVIRANNLRLNLAAESEYGFENLLTDASGRVEFATHGVAEITFSDSSPVRWSNARFTLAGSSSTRANLDYGHPDFLVFGYDQSGDGLNEHSTYFQLTDYESGIFVSQTTSQPVLRSALFHTSDLEGSPVLGRPIDFGIHRNFTDLSGELLAYTIDLLRVEEGNSLNQPGREITSEPWIDYSISQVESGHFELTAMSPVELAFYTFEITAARADGTTADQPLHVTVPVYMDSDGDGQYDVSDSDDDNDGESDPSDAFPKDPSETLDTDSDGVGNNSDNDDDGDGYADDQDLQPLDPLCAVTSDVEDGECVQHKLHGKLKFLDTHGLLHFWSPNDPKIYRWNSTTAHFVEPFMLSPERFAGDSWSHQIYYANDQHAMFVTYNDTIVTRIDLDAPTLEESFFLDTVSMFGDASRIIDDSSPALVFYHESDALNFFSIDTNGQIIDSYIAQESMHGVYGTFRREDVAPFCSNGVSVDSETGEFYEIGLAGDAEDLCREGALVPDVDLHVSPDGQRMISRYDGILDLARNVVAEPPIDVTYYSTRWTNHALFYIDSVLYRGSIQRYSRDGEYLDRMTLPDHGTSSHEIFGRGDHFVLVSEGGNILLLNTYRADD